MHQVERDIIRIACGRGEGRVGDVASRAYLLGGRVDVAISAATTVETPDVAIDFNLQRVRMKDRLPGVWGTRIDADGRWRSGIGPAESLRGSSTVRHT